MRMLLNLSCGDQMELLTADEIPSDLRPSVLYPIGDMIDDENGIEIGNAMTCVTCDTTQIVTAIQES